ncbi:hypothetical protein ACHAXN_001017 [Cyclotella atomus]
MRHVLTQAYKKFFFLACCRHEMCNTHPFWSMIEKYGREYAHQCNVRLTMPLTARCKATGEHCAQ